MILAHESIRRAADAQKLAQQRSFEQALAEERRARESEIVELEAALRNTKSEAEHARLLAEKKEMEAKMEAEARREAHRRAEEAYERAQRAEEEARRAVEARLDAERARSAAEQRALEERQEKEEARARLRSALSEIMDVRDTARGLIVSLPDVLFEFDQSVLTPAGRETLAKLAGIVQLTDGFELRVEGHTDSVGTEDYNLQLSRDRARSVADYLFAQGVSPEKLDAVVGLGESRPVARNDTAEGRQRNRRVEIVFEERVDVTSSVLGSPR